MLFLNEYYPKFNNKFTIDYLQKNINYYPFLTKERLRTDELEVIYSCDDFRLLKGIIPTIR